MEYTHPKKYEGLRIDTPNNQNIVRARVEKYCLRCDKFMGKEHDFSECRIFDTWVRGKVGEKKTCPFDNVAVSLMYPEVRCEIES